MLTQQQIEALIQSTSKHRTATLEEAAQLQQYVAEHLQDITDIHKVKVIAESATELSFSFEQRLESGLSDSFFITLPKQ